MELKEVEGFGGRYMVSPEGKVFSKVKGKIKESFISKTGYERVTLWYHGKQKKFSVHRLVAMAYIPNPNNYPMVNHIDGNKLNNNVSNLEWCDCSMNVQHAYRTGLIHPHTTRVRQLTLDGKLIREWESVKAACDEYNLNHANIVTICNGKTNRKQSGGFRWEYAR